MKLKDIHDTHIKGLFNQ